MFRESCHCVYVNYDGRLCPRHDDCSDPLYLSTPNSQIKIVGLGGFINTTKVAESNSRPCSSSTTDRCAISASFSVRPTCSSVFYLPPSYLNSGAVLKYEKHLWVWNLWDGLNIWVLFLQFSVSLKHLWTFTGQTYLHEESSGIGSKDNKWIHLSKINQILFWHVRGSISIPSLDILR